MRLFWEVTKRAFRRNLTYRAAAVAGLVTNMFFGLVRASVLIALYGQQQSVAGYSVQDAVTYTGLTQALIVYLGVFGWWDLMTSVYRGDVATDLLKPMSLLRFWLAQDAGRSAVAFLLRGVTIMLAYAMFFDISVPRGAWQWLAFGVALVLSWLLSFAYRFLVNLAAFWSPDARGIGRFAFMIVMFFSGFLMPLRFLPEWVQHIAHLTPFPHMLNTVVEVYLGVLTGPEVVRALLMQAAWAVALLAVAQFVLTRATRRLVIQGG